MGNRASETCSKWVSHELERETALQLRWGDCDGGVALPRSLIESSGCCSRNSISIGNHCYNYPSRVPVVLLKLQVLGSTITANREPVYPIQSIVVEVSDFSQSGKPSFDARRDRSQFGTVFRSWPLLCWEMVQTRFLIYFVGFGITQIIWSPWKSSRGSVASDGILPWFDFSGVEIRTLNHYWSMENA